jgi:micrococcal nuclease
MVKKKSKGSAVGVVILLFTALVIIYWIFTNILGLVGIAGVIVGIILYSQKQNFHYISISIIGLILAIAWFLYNEPMNTLAFFFALMTVFSLLYLIYFMLKRNPLWRKFAVLPILSFILFFIFAVNAPVLSMNTTVASNVENSKEIENNSSTEKDLEKNSEQDNNLDEVTNEEQTKEENKDDNELDKTKTVDDFKFNPGNITEKSEPSSVENNKSSAQGDEKSTTELGLVVATVSRVIDGDTVVLSDGSKVRLIGVNTPESTTRTEKYGKEASAYTKSKLEGKQVYLQKDVSETDRYGRLLRIIWLQIPNDDMNEYEIRSKMFNADLVINGYAEPSTYPPDVKYSEYFRKFAREAREANKGLWAYGSEGTTKGDFDTQTHASKTNNTSKSSNTSTSTSSSNSNTSTSTPPSSNSKESFKNCTELRKVYPNGVSSDHPAYEPKHDRDKDGWACER